MAKRKKKRIVIGIDTGTNTGFAVWDNETESFRLVDSMKIHTAMKLVEAYLKEFPDNVAVYVEDARKAVYGRQNRLDSAKAQGAGSVKRDARIWEDYLTDLQADFRMMRPASKKVNQQEFKTLSKWDARTNNHSRDAGMIALRNR